MASPVVLINVFEVPAGNEKDFLAWWERSSELPKDEPGFIDAKLHRTLQATARFQFVNVAHWETREALDTARNKHEAALRAPVGRGNPSLYEVALQF